MWSYFDEREREMQNIFLYITFYIFYIDFFVESRHYSAAEV
jgi:hypothetical protein